MYSNKLTTALSYAKRRWAILPVYGVRNGMCTCTKGNACTRPGKHPRTTNGVKDATTNTKLIKKWWKQWPTANIAIATGTKSGLLVLDLDPGNGGKESLKAALKQLGKLPTTVTTITGGNGNHFIFTHPKKAVRSDTAGKLLGRGLDVLSGGRYFIAPGSVGLKRTYAWVKGKTMRDLEPAKLPKAWESRLRLGKDDSAAKTTSVAVGAEIAEGGRNTTLTSIAGAMRRAGVTEDAMMAALNAQNAMCDPPLEEAEVRGIVASVCSLYPEGAGGSDPALQLIHGVLANDFAGGRHLILEQGRFWVFERTHWERVSDEWIKNKILSAIEKFQIKAGANTASLLDQGLRLLQARLSAKDDRLSGISDGKAVINTLTGELWIADNGSVELRRHSPESYLTHCLRISYDPLATCPTYDSALQGIFSKADDPADMVRHWHEMTGYILQPRRNLATIVVGLGGGSNGKTTLFGTIIKLLGDHLVSAQPIGSFEGSRFAMASLFGKLMLLDDDVNASTRLPDGFLKTISEGKVVTGEEKYKSPFNFRVHALPVLLCNSVPSLTDLSFGMQRRLMVLPFDKKFVGKGKDATLFDRIWASELPGVLNRALEGLGRLRQRSTGFQLPTDVKAANKKFLSDGNPVPSFIDECCTEDIIGGIYLADFYVRYQSWCVESGITMKQQRNKVKQNLKNLRYKFGRGNKGPKVMGLRFT
jgi:putative DNA primase/helicase